MKFKINTIEKDIPENVVNFLESDTIGMTNCQSFYPLLRKFHRGKSIEKCKLKNPYEVINLEKISESNDDESGVIVNPKKRIFWGTVRENDKDTSRRKIFLKMTPILEPTTHLMKKDHCQNLLPNKGGMGPIQNKINNIHNCAYVDSFATYLMSYLVEKKMCPAFPLFFGTLNGVAKEYFYDVSDEFESYQQQDWFQLGLMEKRFNHRCIEWDEDEKRRLENFPDMGKHSFRNIIPPSFRDPIGDTNLFPGENQLEQEMELENLDDLLDNFNDSDDSDNNNGGDSDGDSDSDNDINILKQGELESILKDISMMCDRSVENNTRSDSNPGLNLENDSGSEHEMEDIINNNKDTIVDEKEDNQENNQEDDKCSESEDESMSQDDAKNMLFEMDSNLSVCSELHEGGHQFLSIPEFPVQITMIEHLENTFDNLLVKDCNMIPEDLELSERYNLESCFQFWKNKTVYDNLERKWKAYLFQICFGLSVAQKHFDFTHNDLHSNNIMYENTTQEYLYYKIDGKYYQVPTYGVILKIIDYGRAIYKVNDFQYFNDIFSYHNEAGEQYTYPFDDEDLMDENVKPNPSFDLSRLGVSILDDMYPQPVKESELYQMINSWTLDHKGRYVGRFDDFELYKQIARYVHHAVPITQLRKPLFDFLTISKESISKDTHIYVY